MSEQKLTLKAVNQEALRIVRVALIPIAAYWALSTAAYAYIEWNYPESFGLFSLVALLDWAACYAITVFAMGEAGHFRPGKKGGVGAYLVLGIVSGIAVLIGLALLILPGLYLLLRWLPAYCDTLVRGEGPVRAMERAWAATANAVMPFGVHLFCVIALMASSSLVWLVPDEIYYAAPMTFVVGSNLLTTLGTVWYVVLPVAAYGLLMAPGALAEVRSTPA